MKYPHTYILIPITPDRRKRVMETVESIWANTDRELTPYSIVLYENNYIGYPNAILDMAENIEGFVFIGASDLIHGKDWLTYLWHRQQRHGYAAVVEPMNELWNGNLCQHALMHTALLKKYFHRRYFHFYCDNEMDLRARAEGRYVYCPEAPMEHRHLLNGKAEDDEGYRVVLDPERNEKDRLIYEQRKANNWPE